MKNKAKELEDKLVLLNQVKAKKIFQRAYENHLGGLIEEAINDYQESIQLFPTAEAYTFLAWAISSKRDFEQSIELCRKAIELNPDYGNPYNDIGAYLIELGKEDDAIIWLEKAILAKEYDSRFYPYYNLGRIYKEKNFVKKAITCFEKAASIKPEFSLAIKMLEELKRTLN